MATVHFRDAPSQHVLNRAFMQHNLSARINGRQINNA